LGVKASLLEGADRVHDARCVLTQQLAEYRALPAGQKRADAEAAVQERLQALSPPTEPCASP
jgi:hypothetical protein